MKLREALKHKLTKKELSEFKAAFDVVGEIAVLEIDDALKKKQKIIAETLLSLHKNIRTVLKKADEHTGEFRTQKMRWLAGRKTKKTIHKETYTRIKLDVEKVYFSARLSTERKRIMELVKSSGKSENILVMFSGCAPYPCVIARNTKAKGIVGIEINPAGHKYALENVRLNKLKNVKLFQGDVKKIIPKLISEQVNEPVDEPVDEQVNEQVEDASYSFDRIIMPLPKSAEDFLPTALLAARKGTIVHFYDFLHVPVLMHVPKPRKKPGKHAKMQG